MSNSTFCWLKLSLKLHIGESLQSANMLLLAMGHPGRAKIVIFGEFEVLLFAFPSSKLSFILDFDALFSAPATICSW